MIGVDYELFWTLNPKSLQPFVKAFKLIQRYDDEISWMNGMYIRFSVASVLGKEVSYPKKPVFSGNDAHVEETAEDRQRLIKEKFVAQMSKVNSKFKK